MDAKRLEEIRQWAHYQAIEQMINGISVDADCFRDLARCAAAWAKLERIMMSGRGVIELFGYRGREIHWSLYPGGLYGSEHYKGDTAIAAVEAAPEVTDANKG